MINKSNKWIQRYGILIALSAVFLFLYLRTGPKGKNAATTKEIIAALEACPSWHYVGGKDSGNSSSLGGWHFQFRSWFTPNSKMQIMETIKDLAQNDLCLLGEAIKEYVEEKEKIDPHGNWRDNIELLNRYVFKVPTENLWPLSYDGEGNLELTGQFRMSVGSRGNPLDEFYFFWKEYGRRPGTAPPGLTDTLPEGGIPVLGYRKLTEAERKRAFYESPDQGK
jgi:hypothetical protein